ncbi:DUF3450 domain-containing protein [Abyssibacter profundi]|uniref:DUF3450 domain-containing protein n=1 Tax=Abyssibacter profundi TaxID=2182787 RepID=A0A383XRQ5_9GAMM|nr:DUF3450 domain-containing protein [Abyssibacter profundi]PWN55309.1 hypothetical protein DEH80_12540 [Abyssibacter profundi]
MSDMTAQRLIIGVVASGMLGLALPAAASTATVNRVIQTQVQAERNAKGTQRQIDNLDDETQAIVADYRATLIEIDSLKSYVAQLERQVAAQQEEIGSIEEQLQQIESTNRGVLPLMEDMITALDQFVALDVPFLPKERSDRVAELETLMSRADISTAEKYRRILEAYQIEMEFGRNIEAYQGELGDTGREVDFLRVGRLALLYSTPNGEEFGYWNNESRQWVVDSDLEDFVTDGLKIARKQSPPNLMLMPVQAPQEAN